MLQALTSNLPLDELSAAKSVLPPSMRCALSAMHGAQAPAQTHACAHTPHPVAAPCCSTRVSAGCRPKPETLKRRADEAKAAQHARRGTRGAARVRLGQEKAAASRKTAMPKGKSPAGAAGKGSSLFAFGKRVGPAAGGARKGPFAFSATVKSGGAGSSSSGRPAKSGGKSAASGSSTRWGGEEEEGEGSGGHKRQAFSSIGSSKGTGGKRSVASSRTPASKGRRRSSAEHATRKQSLMRSYKK